MIIFLRKLDKNTHYNEIVSFIEPAIKGGFFRKSGQIESVQMLIVKDNEANTVEYHSLVQITPEAAARRAIEKLNNQFLHGHPIQVRPYISRCWKNERRHSTLAPNFVLICQRKMNRRRHLVERKIVNPDLMGRFGYCSL